MVDKYAKNDDLYPKDVYLRAKCNQRLHFANSILYIRVLNCSTTYYNGGYEVAQEKIDALGVAFDLLEVQLGDDPFLVGDHLTVADICAMGLVTSIDEIYLPIDAAKYPKIIAWLKRIKSLDFYEKMNGQFVKKYKEMLNTIKDENIKKHSK